MDGEEKEKKTRELKKKKKILNVIHVHYWQPEPKITPALQLRLSVPLTIPYSGRHTETLHACRHITAR